jgi:flagellar protein FlbD
MIKLTSLCGAEFLLNAELIRYVESKPDTFISLVNGDRVIVRESMDEVWRRTIEYQRSKLLIPQVAAWPHSERSGLKNLHDGPYPLAG